MDSIQLTQARRRAVRFISLACVGLIVGCTSGSTSVNESNQEPDPIIVDFPIAYIIRPLLVDEDNDPVRIDIREPFEFNPGAILYLRDRASPTASAVDISTQAFPPLPVIDEETDEETGETAAQLYDVKDIEASYDGTKIIFSMRAPEIENADDDEQPTWNIWEYDISAATLTRLIESDILAEAGHDIAPHYLPDGRVVFSSTRQRTSKAILLDESKPQFSALDEDGDEPSAVLHTIEVDGSDIRQITYNQSHDLNPTVRASGKILFSRWDNMGARSEFNFYEVNPDGSELSIVYGAHSHETEINESDTATLQFSDGRELPSGEILSLLDEFTTMDFGTDFFAIDAENYTDINQPTADNSSLSGPAQVSLTETTVAIDDSISTGGRFNYAYPLFDGTSRLLISWSPCRLADGELILPCTEDRLGNENAVAADPLYGLWVYDLNESTQLPIVTTTEGQMVTEVLSLQSRDFPPSILDNISGVDVDSNLVDENAGVLHIRSVYDLDGTDSATPSIAAVADPTITTASERTARFLRITKAVSMPDDDVKDFNRTAFGRSTAQSMKEIIGYAPIEPDGSVKVKVPANIAFSITILDANGRRTSPLHLNWLQVRPGEVLECIGCHTATSELPHGRLDAQPDSANAGAPSTGSAFPNTESSLIAVAAETMAETFTRINGIPNPAFNLTYDDVWTDSNIRAKDTSFSFDYADLTTPPPVSSACLTAWAANCRITINYPDHIAPLWDVNRQILDVDEVTVLSDNTCTTCHNITDENSVAQVPAGQIDLRNIASNDEPDHLVSYRELFFNGADQDEQEIVDNNLVFREIPSLDGQGNTIFQLDDEGELLPDEFGQPIPVLVRVRTNRPLNERGAIANSSVLNLFATGGSHADYLTDAEEKLIIEWLDVGAQYFNNPFDAPDD